MIGRVKTWLAMAGAAVLALVLAFARGRRAGYRRKEEESHAETRNRIEKGREAVRDGRGTGTPAERLRRNDGRW